MDPLVNVDFEPLQDLFEDASPITKRLLKDAVAQSVKTDLFPGVGDMDIDIDFNPQTGSDILIKRVDPENALGYSTFADGQDYFNRLSVQLYEPTLDELEESYNG